MLRNLFIGWLISALFVLFIAISVTIRGYGIIINPQAWLISTTIFELPVVLRFLIKKVWP